MWLTGAGILSPHTGGTDSHSLSLVTTQAHIQSSRNTQGQLTRLMTCTVGSCQHTASHMRLTAFFSLAQIVYTSRDTLRSVLSASNINWSTLCSTISQGQQMGLSTSCSIVPKWLQQVDSQAEQWSPYHCTQQHLGSIACEGNSFLTLWTLLGSWGHCPKLLLIWNSPDIPFLTTGISSFFSALCPPDCHGHVSKDPSSQVF